MTRLKIILEKLEKRIIDRNQAIIVGRMRKIIEIDSGRKCYESDRIN